MTRDIFIGLGANLPSSLGPPMATLAAALAAVAGAGIAVVARSPWYESAPLPPSGQPWFVNGVARVATGLAPAALLARLLAIEAAFGRRRGEANAARALDLDLLAHGDLIATGPEPPLLPHPRLATRAFVLLPLRDIAPDWRHPVDGRSIDALIAALPPGQAIRRLG